MVPCISPYVIDGDTIACANLPAHVRFVAIDAPELAGHCRRGRVCVAGDPIASRGVLATLLARGASTCQPAGYDRWRRILARCFLADVDLSCAMVAAGGAIERYAPLGRCPVPPRDLPRVEASGRARLAVR